MKLSPEGQAEAAVEVAVNSTSSVRASTPTTKNAIGNIRSGCSSANRVGGRAIAMRQAAAASATAIANATASDANATVHATATATVNATATATTAAASTATTASTKGSGVSVSTSAGGSFGGCFEILAGLAVNAGAIADFFGLFDQETVVPLFNRDFELFKVRAAFSSPLSSPLL
jgi:hypothetical protein